MSKPTLGEYLAEVRERCEKATKGPWKAELWECGCCARIAPEITYEVNGVAGMRPSDAEFAAHSRTDIEALLGMVEAWQELWDCCAESDGDPLQLIEAGIDLKAKLESLIPPSAEEEEKP